jgi:small subunit ribosomal protein S7e
MFNRREKIIKKDGSKPSELEEEVAKRLHQIELENMELKKELSIILITSAQMVDYEDADKTPAQYLLVRILHRSLGAFKKAGYKVVEQLEAHYEKPVMIVANRTIISPSAKHHPSQMRPRSRTLTAVHKEILGDVCFPSTISGRGIRVDIDGKKHQKVYLDPLDKETMESKLAAITHCYHKLTTHKIALGFSKPTLFQQKTLEQREKAKGKS